MYLYGAGGHAKVIMDILENSGVSVSGLFDDNPVHSQVYGKSVLGKYAGQSLDAPLLISIGDNKIRAGIAGKLSLEYGTAIHQSAIISPSARIGVGTVVVQGAIIQVDAVVGEHSIINTGASIDHECQIGNFVHLAPGAVLSGNVTVGEGTQIGAGAIVIPGVSIGKWCRIGAGAVVIRDIPDHVEAVGNPARVTKQL
jgi:sugar O-acyltransferase (sialic acid O-acetyltransferase NeuD family)